MTMADPLQRRVFERPHVESSQSVAGDRPASSTAAFFAADDSPIQTSAKVSGA
jgi:hypothetical protein